MIFRNLTIVFSLAFAIISTSGCTQSKPNFVVNGQEYLGADEIAALNLDLEQHARTGAMPVFIWLQTTVGQAPTFEAFKLAAPSLKHITKGCVLIIQIKEDQVFLVSHDKQASLIPDAEQERILQEVLQSRLSQGFLFEGMYAAVQELTALLQQ
jgi:uncharacterized membrane protein YgcG